MQVHYYLYVYINSPTHQYQEISLKYWTTERGKRQPYISGVDGINRESR